MMSDSGTEHVGRIIREALSAVSSEASSVVTHPVQRHPLLSFAGHQSGLFDTPIETEQPPISRHSARASVPDNRDGRRFTAPWTALNAPSP